MKNKLIMYFIFSLSVIAFIITLLFYIVSNYENEENSKRELNRNNYLVNSFIKDESDDNLNLEILKKFVNTEIRVTIIDKNGEVLFDSMKDKDSLDNHNDRVEVKMAREKGEGYVVRLSDTIHKDMLYYATSFDDGRIIRSSYLIDRINVINYSYTKYFVGIMFFAILLAIVSSLYIANSFVIPVKDLQQTTALMAQGDFERRAKIYYDDEVGKLAVAFNYMADKLQYTINDSKDKQNRLQAILKSMDSGVIAVDRFNRVIMINPYAEKIFGVNKDIIGQKFITIIKDVEFENILRESTQKVTEMKLLRPVERDLRIKVAQIINGDEIIGKVAVVQDITDLKKLVNLRKQFVANVSHELKTPLTSIKGFTETLRYVEDEKTKNKFLKIINEEADRLTFLINDILTLSDIESGRRFNLESFDVKAVVEDVIALLEQLSNKKNIKLDYSCEDNIILYGDRNKFKQMLINLGDNAIKYSEENDLVFLHLYKEDEILVVNVCDTGIGIDEDHIPRLFERFYRVDKARSRAKGGTGLGLAIVKHIVLGFNGTIDVESKIDEGSTFTVKIPLKTKQEKNKNFL
ncbi:MAG: ATP-binding protein [Clostridiaceae bacterium]